VSSAFFDLFVSSSVKLHRSSVLNEANLGSVLSECLSAEHKIVLPDEAEVAAGDSASTGVLAVLAWVGLKLVRHVFENE
jgi:hypothetical protein